MQEILKVDLKIARQQAALSNQDVATLLGTSTARLSKLENGNARPRVRELIAFSLIYGRSLDEVFTLCSSRLTNKIKANLAEIDFSNSARGLDRRKRLDTLNHLAARLQDLNTRSYDG